MTEMPLRVQELTRFVDRQSHRRVRDLSVEVRPGRIVLRGFTETYHVKQLAQHELLRRLPEAIRLDNRIVVGNYLTSTTGRYADRPLTVCAG